jgi:hypothetical protein
MAFHCSLEWKTFDLSLSSRSPQVNSCHNRPSSSISPHEINQIKHAPTLPSFLAQ